MHLFSSVKFTANNLFVNILVHSSLKSLKLFFFQLQSCNNLREAATLSIDVIFEVFYDVLGVISLFMVIFTLIRLPLMLKSIKQLGVGLGWQQLRSLWFRQAVAIFLDVPWLLLGWPLLALLSLPTAFHQMKYCKILEG
jgi:hypothetical protein